MSVGFMPSVSAAADKALSDYLTDGPDEVAVDHRAIMHRIKAAVAGYLNPASRWHAAPDLIDQALGWTAALRDLQGEDGLFDSAGNLDSPPDSAFTINDAAAVQTLLGRSTDSAPAADLADALTEILRAAAPGLARGGLHTPNHRWELTAALCRLQATLPERELRDLDVAGRIEDWLAEGVDIDADGIYSERSPNYAARVSNPSLLAVGDLLGRADLIELVHRNLHAQRDLTDASGVVESMLSRRQDQHADFPLGPFLMQFRRFGLAGCGDCAAMAQLAAKQRDFDAVNAVAEVLADPGLGAELPPAAPIAHTEVRHFASVGLVRVRKGDSLLTAYGGSDVPRSGRVGSGQACNPTFLRWRWGGVSLHSVRLSRQFFGLGPFRAAGLEWRSGSAHLAERLSAGYYQPLPADRRRADGRYRLEFEGRYSSALSFSERQRVSIELDTELVITPRDAGVDLAATFRGAATSYAFELCFRPGGEFDGVTVLGPDLYLLADGEGSYRIGDDEIVFGPGGGSGPRQPARYDPGEAYNFLGGTDALTWPRVYLTGRTPGSAVITLRGRSN